ncbi:MAG: winged helix-turn-helix domain-containing protein [Porticoccaceae bacterium]
MARKTASVRQIPATPRLRVQVRILFGDEIALGPGKADLLDAIRTCGSISAAGKHMGMSYRRAWLLVDSMNRCFSEALVTTAKGGSGGGGAQLTLRGEDILKHYRVMQAAADAVAASHFNELKAFLRPEPLAPAYSLRQSRDG